MLKKVLPVFLFFLYGTAAFGQDPRGHWVDSVYNTLTREEKIWQLFMVPISRMSNDELDRLVSQVSDGRFGGVIVTGGGPVGFASAMNRLQKSSRVPLWSGISAEWGLAQSLDSTMSLPKPLMTSAWKEDSLVTLWGKEIARQLRLLGININFAPNADTEMTGDDYLRHFSDDRDFAIRGALSFTRAMQHENILVVAKHLGKSGIEMSADTAAIMRAHNEDSTGTSILRYLMSTEVSGVHTRHLRFPLAGKRVHVTPSLSPGVLRQMNFNGLVFGDATQYQKTTGKVKPGEAELAAFLAGNDVLIGPVTNPAWKKISKQVRKNKHLEHQLEKSVKKVLAAKFHAGLNHPQPIDTDNLSRKLNSPEVLLLKHRLSEAAVTVVKNESDFLPIVQLEDRSFLLVSVGPKEPNVFSHFLNKYAPVRTIEIREPQDTAAVHANSNEIVILGIYSNASSLENQLLSWTRKLISSHRTIVVHFGDPRMLNIYSDATALVAAYTDEDFMSQIVPQVIFGAIAAQGILPIDTRGMRHGIGLGTEAINRLSYSLPEEAGLDSRTLDQVKVIMNEAISNAATPGCHVLIARNGKVVYEQSAGSLTYQNKIPVTDETIYDLASVTKVSATLQTTMFLYERGLIDLNKKASYYLPELRGSNKENLILKDILTHQAGLWPTIFYWTQTVKDSLLLPEYYSKEESPDYPYPVAGGLYAARSMKDSIRKWTIHSKMRPKPSRTPYDYVYSDVGSYLLYYIAEKILNQPMEDFLQQNFYEPIGASTTGYLPLRRFPIERVAPTENDTLFRHTLVAGYVHDQGAAMYGGVAGHAGLFSDANDLAKLGQMWLQKGSYGGVRYFKPQTIELFTGKQFERSRRGLGWDRPVQSDWNTLPSPDASAKTFGHTGFTGTCIWVDPEFNLVYIFLSNRVHPDVNTKLLATNIRTRIHNVIYQSIFEYQATHN